MQIQSEILGAGKWGVRRWGVRKWDVGVCRSERRPRLTPVDGSEPARQGFKDHITGEILNRHKIVQRVSQGIYSRYHIRHLNLQ